MKLYKAIQKLRSVRHFLAKNPVRWLGDASFGASTKVSVARVVAAKDVVVTRSITCPSVKACKMRTERIVCTSLAMGCLQLLVGTHSSPPSVNSRSFPIALSFASFASPSHLGSGASISTSITSGTGNVASTYTCHAEDIALHDTPPFHVLSLSQHLSLSFS